MNKASKKIKQIAKKTAVNITCTYLDARSKGKRHREKSFLSKYLKQRFG